MKTERCFFCLFDNYQKPSENFERQAPERESIMNTHALPLVSFWLLKSWKRTWLDIPQVSHTWIICTRLNTHLVFILSIPLHRCPKKLQSSVEQHRRLADFSETFWGMANLAVLKLVSQPPLRDVMNPACCGVWRGCAWRGWPVVYTTPYSSQRSLRRGDLFFFEMSDISMWSSWFE